MKRGAWNLWAVWLQGRPGKPILVDDALFGQNLAEISVLGTPW
jgi:hypothetical protein